MPRIAKRISRFSNTDRAMTWAIAAMIWIIGILCVIMWIWTGPGGASFLWFYAAVVGLGLPWWIAGMLMATSGHRKWCPGPKYLGESGEPTRWPGRMWHNLWYAHEDLDDPADASELGAERRGRATR